MEQYMAAADARNMPCHPESERSVLGAMLRSREAALLAIEMLAITDEELARKLDDKRAADTAKVLEKNAKAEAEFNK